MKTIGLIGGLSWESSIEYYRIINETVKDKLGGLHSAKIVMYSFDFEGIKEMQYQGRWDEATQVMIDAAKKLEKAEADCVVICSNTMHKMAEAVQAAIQIPLLHIADATAEKIKSQELKTVGLLATNFTMEEEFYKGRLIEKHGLQVITPKAEERLIVHKIIYEELCLGKILHSSKEQYKKIIDNLVEQGAEGIILGCTEITLLIKAEDSQLPLFDTTLIHAQSAVEYAIE
jgi:aspartate racemase